MRFIYTIIYYLSMPFVLIRLLWRSRHAAGYRKRWHERFGYINRITDGDTIWVHAVSVGETIAAIPLIKALLEQYHPQYHIIVTATTPTGSALVTKHFQDQVHHAYTPFDIPTSVRRFLKRARIKFCIIMETELWPNLFATCKQQKIPIVLANARLSERSTLRYQLIAGLTKNMLNSCYMVAAQGVLDGERYLKLGLDPSNLLISGNIKFDMTIADNLIEQGKAIKQQIGHDRCVFIAASTHDNEEAKILEAFQIIRQRIPNLFLVLVPRHANRFQKVAQMCLAANFTTVLRSQKTPIEKSTDILLVDTIGELRMIYAAGDIAFVGGSLVPVGGHNLIEPAALGLPILTGPNLQNFTEISKLLQNAGAVQIVTNTQSIADAVIALCSASALREKIGQCAKDTIETNRGALKKHLDCIASCIAENQKSN